MSEVNEFGQPIGNSLGDWTAPLRPAHRSLVGRYVQVRPLHPERDARPIYDAYKLAPDSHWTYLSFGPLTSPEQLSSILRSLTSLPDWQLFALDVEGDLQGFLSFLRIDAAAGVIEIGSIVFAPALQRTRAATEAIYLMIAHAFDSGYRRCEWKCDDLNAPSIRAAKRFGFTYEGTFRKATHYKGRSRDTAWFAITDDDWPSLAAGFERWLDPDNFDSVGQQVSALRFG